MHVSQRGEVDDVGSTAVDLAQAWHQLQHPRRQVEGTHALLDLDGKKGFYQAQEEVGAVDEMGRDFDLHWIIRVGIGGTDEVKGIWEARNK